MRERLTEAEVAAIRERWEATERRIVQREAAAKRAGVMGDRERLNRPPGHEDIPRLLATLEAERARVTALVKAGDALAVTLAAEVMPRYLEMFDASGLGGDDASGSVVVPVVEVALDTWRALTLGEAGTDGE